MKKLPREFYPSMDPLEMTEIKASDLQAQIVRDIKKEPKNYDKYSIIKGTQSFSEFGKLFVEDKEWSHRIMKLVTMIVEKLYLLVSKKYNRHAHFKQLYELAKADSKVINKV